MKLQQRFQTNDGLRIGYWTWGEREDRQVFFTLHDLLSVGYSYAFVAELLEPEFFIVAPDLRGHGNSDWVPGGSYEFIGPFVRDAQQLLDHLEIGQTVVMGHGFGAVLAWLFAAVFPQWTLGTVLIDPVEPTAFDGNIVGWLRSWLEPDASKGDRASAAPGSVARAVQELFPESSLLSNEHKRLLARHHLCPRPDGSLQWCHDPKVSKAGFCLPPEVIDNVKQHLRCPFLVLEAGSCHQPFENLVPPGQLVSASIAGATHASQLEAPQAVADVVRRHVHEWLQ